jgi:hypothetical protein
MCPKQSKIQVGDIELSVIHSGILLFTDYKLKVHSNG